MIYKYLLLLICISTSLKSMEFCADFMPTKDPLCHYFKKQLSVAAIKKMLAQGESLGIFLAQLPYEEGRLTSEAMRWIIRYGALAYLCHDEQFCADFKKAHPEKVLRAVAFGNQNKALQFITALLARESSLSDEEIKILNEAFLIALGRQKTEVKNFIWKNGKHLITGNTIAEAFYIAAFTGQQEEIALLLASLNPTSACFTYVITQALYWAIAQGHPAVVELILDAMSFYSIAINIHHILKKAQQAQAYVEAASQSIRYTAMEQIVEVMKNYQQRKGLNQLRQRLPEELVQHIGSFIPWRLSPTTF